MDLKSAFVIWQLAVATFIHIPTLIRKEVNVSQVYRDLIHEQYLIQFFIISEQQVTLYSHVDDNNWWIINKVETNNATALEYVKNGDIVRLTHLDTRKRLHTHDVRPGTNDIKYQYEVR